MFFIYSCVLRTNTTKCLNMIVLVQRNSTILHQKQVIVTFLEWPISLKFKMINEQGDEKHTVDA